MISLAALLLLSLSAPSIPLTPCTLAHPQGGREPARCGTVVTDAVTKTGAPVTVGFAVLRATGSKPSTTPLLLLAGGPGQSATRDFVPFVPVLERLRADRDLILVDVRGTGRSTPVRCKDERPLGARLAATADDDDELLRRCFAELPIDPAKLTTADNVNDLERVRVALGVERWHVLGVSYGTRLAVAYDGAHRAHTASLILDGVAPLDHPLGEDIAADNAASLTGLGDDVVAAFVAVRDRLKAAPATVTVRHPTTGTPLELTVTADLVSSAVRMLLYSDETRAVLGHLLRTANTGDLVPFASVAVLTAGSVDDAIHVPVNLATICAEDVPFLKDKAPSPAPPLFPDDVASMRKNCRAFTPAKRERIVPQPTTTTTLLLSGQFDPITPPRHVERVLSLFPRGRHIVLKGMAHNVLPRGCVAALIDDSLALVDDGSDLATLDADCIKHVDAFPSFIDALGPTP